MQLKPFWHNIEQLQNKEVDIMSSNIENGGNDTNSIDILQLVGQWLTTTGDAISLTWQAIALENDKVQQVQDQKEKKLQELQLQQTLQQMTRTQEKIRLLQKPIEKLENDKLQQNSRPKREKTTRIATATNPTTNDTDTGKNKTFTKTNRK